MAKRMKNKITRKAVKIIAKRRIKRKTRKIAENQRNSSRKIYKDSGDKNNKVILPEDILNKARLYKKITIWGNHYLFNIKNWNLSLEKFKEGFIKNNIVKKINVLKEELREIKKDTFVKELFKDIKYDNVGEKMESQSITTRKNNKVIINNSDFVF